MDLLHRISAENDPLAWLHPFPGTAMTPFQAHWHEIVISTVFYFFIQAIAPAVCTKLVGKAYTGLDNKTKVNFDIHAVSMVQCVISVLLLLCGLSNAPYSNRWTDPESSIFGYTPYLGFVAAMTIGYFIWDLFVCAWYFKLFGVSFLFHGFAALYVFACSLRPYCLPWAPAFLLFELSTPFVNINWFATRLPAGTISETIVVVNGILLLVTFFSVRIVWGFYAAATVAYDMWRVLDKAPIFLPVSILFLNVSLDSLNVVWFLKMFQIAKKKVSQHSKTPIPALKTAKFD